MSEILRMYGVQPVLFVHNDVQKRTGSDLREVGYHTPMYGSDSLALYTVTALLKAFRIGKQEQAIASKKRLETILDGLQTAQNGLRWYWENIPEQYNQGDAEADELIQQAVAAVNQLLEEAK